MRTTLSIDDDVLDAARALAARQRRSIGDVLSELARKSLERAAPPVRRNGILLLPANNPRARMTLAKVNALRDGAP